MARVTGIGGVFLRSKNAKALQKWYVNNLGLEPGGDGCVILKWGGDRSGSTVWDPEGNEIELWEPAEGY